jgi:S1-C subfamily serine protease
MPLILVIPLVILSCIQDTSESIELTSTPASPVGAMDTVEHVLFTTLPSIADVVTQARPSVVAIAVSVPQIGFFGSRLRNTVRSGSGVIFHESGYIITNNHVVENAEKIQVTMDDGRIFDATLVGLYPTTDLAVIDIEGENFVAAQIGKSEALRIGDWVIAIGNALGLQGGPTVTLGVVGAKKRVIETPDNRVLYDMIQTDAAINPGNSGGALINLNGEVVGINTSTTLAEGINFAVAMETAISVANQLVDQGRVNCCHLGVYVGEVTPEIAMEKNLSSRVGAFIPRLAPGGAAEQAGLLAEDLIVKINDTPIENSGDLFRFLRAQSIGAAVTVQVLRNGEKKDFVVVLTEIAEV